MPVPKLFKRFSSKNTLKVTPDSSPPTSPDVAAKHEKDALSEALVVTAVVPTFPDNLTEAWAAANKELPQARGVEKLLNRVGALIIDGFPCAPALNWLYRGGTELLDPFAW